MTPEAHDYIVVGAGSAGCVLANRLTEDGKSSVALLEAGGDDRPLWNLPQALTNVKIQVPGAIAEVMKDPRVFWPYLTEPDASTDGRRHPWLRGRVLGGSSSVNGMIYVRGQHADYDHWRQLGCEGWAWDDVLPYFKRTERYEGGEDAWRGRGGPLGVTQVANAPPIAAAAIEAFEQAGIPRSRDVNGARQEGVEPVQLTVRNGRRSSASAAYLRPAMRRPNLRVETKALVRRVIFEGRRAVGVEYERGGQIHIIRARREVILSGGVVNSPQLLELSGVGAAHRLAALGIPVVADSPRVGEDLQDHYNVSMIFRLRPGVRSLNELARPSAQLRALAEYLLTAKGTLADGPCCGTAFVRTRPELEEPDIKFVILALSMGPKQLPNGRHTYVVDEAPGLTLTPAQIRPDSRGSIHLRTPDPHDAPAIAPNYLSHPNDRRVIVDALKIGRRISEQPALASYIEGPVAPPSDIRTDEAFLAFARQTGMSGLHGVGTCQMGGAPGSVLDPQLRVRGVEGLRVVDASIMPRLVSGNTNAPTIMIAERAADLIRGRRAGRAEDGESPPPVTATA